jgi:hypothetical protein
MEASGLKFEDESKVLAAKKDLLDVKNLGGWFDFI